MHRFKAGLALPPRSTGKKDIQDFYTSQGFPRNLLNDPDDHFNAFGKLYVYQPYMAHLPISNPISEVTDPVDYGEVTLFYNYFRDWIASTWDSLTKPNITQLDAPSFKQFHINPHLNLNSYIFNNFSMPCYEGYAIVDQKPPGFLQVVNELMPSHRYGDASVSQLIDTMTPIQELANLQPGSIGFNLFLVYLGEKRINMDNLAEIVDITHFACFRHRRYFNGIQMWWPFGSPLPDQSRIVFRYLFTNGTIKFKKCVLMLIFLQRLVLGHNRDNPLVKQLLAFPVRENKWTAADAWYQIIKVLHSDCNFGASSHFAELKRAYRGEAAVIYHLLNQKCGGGLENYQGAFMKEFMKEFVFIYTVDEIYKPKSIIDKFILPSTQFKWTGIIASMDSLSLGESLPLGRPWIVKGFHETYQAATYPLTETLYWIKLPPNLRFASESTFSRFVHGFIPYGIYMVIPKRKGPPHHMAAHYRAKWYSFKYGGPFAESWKLSSYDVYAGNIVIDKLYSAPREDDWTANRDYPEALYNGQVGRMASRSQKAIEEGIDQTRLVKKKLVSMIEAIERRKRMLVRPSVREVTTKDKKTPPLCTVDETPIAAAVKFDWLQKTGHFLSFHLELDALNGLHYHEPHPEPEWYWKSKEWYEKFPNLKGNLPGIDSLTPSAKITRQQMSEAKDAGY